MGRKIVYCESCGVRLCEEDFSLGKAELHLRRPFCVPCKPPAAAIPGGKNRPSAFSALSRRFRKPMAGMLRRPREF